MIFSRTELEFDDRPEDVESLDSETSKGLFRILQTNKPTIVDALRSAGIQNYDIILKDSEDLAALAKKKPEIKRLELTDDEAGVIACYTLQTSIGIKSPYKVINESISGSRNNTNLMSTRKLIYLLLSGLRKLPHFRPSAGQILYRGLKLKVPQSEEEANGHQYYVIGKNVTWWGFTSTTANFSAINDFIKEKKASTIFNIGGDGLWGYDIKAFSQFQKEEEVLLEPEAKVCVNGIASTRGSLTISVTFQPFDHLVLEDIIPVKKIPALPPKLQVLENVKVENLLYGGFELSWVAEANEEFVFQTEIKKVITPNGTSRLVYEGKEMKCYVKGLEIGGAYKVRVRCKSGDVVSEWSKEVFVKVGQMNVDIGINTLKAYANDTNLCSKVLREMTVLSEEGK